MLIRMGSSPSSRQTARVRRLSFPEVKDIIAVSSGSKVSLHTMGLSGLKTKSRFR